MPEAVGTVAVRVMVGPAVKSLRDSSGSALINAAGRATFKTPDDFTPDDFAAADFADLAERSERI